jgi:hypothetical protein
MKRGTRLGKSHRSGISTLVASERGTGAGGTGELRRESVFYSRRPESGADFSRALRFRGRMCRNIKTLFNFDPPATEEEVRAAALQFVRKLSGFTAPSKSNQAAFDRAVADTTRVAQRLLETLVTTSEARNREVEAAKAKAQSLRRFGPKVDRASF